MHAVATETESQTLAQQFTQWAAGHLGLEIGGDGSGRFWLDVPPAARAEFDDQPRLHFTFDKELYAAGDDDLELVAPGGRLLSWLIEQVRDLGNVAHAAPADQPSSVHEISSRLFPAYRLEGGTARLAGCTLEDRLALKFTFRLRLEGLDPRDELIEILLSSDGQPMDEEQIRSLGLGEVIALDRPPRLGESEIQWLVEAGVEQAERRRLEAEQLAAQELAPARQQEERQLAEYFSKTRADVASALSNDLSPEERAAVEEQLAGLDLQLQRRLAGLEERFLVHAEVELVATMLIWCKHASGKLRFTFGQHATDLPFAGWARTLTPPRWTCPHTGAASLNLAATDDGRISVAEEIDVCQRTGRRVLRRELVLCAVTGQRVLPEFISRCPVTAENVLTDALVQCPECRQQVSPRAMEQERCGGCRGRQEVNKSDARLARVFGEHPKLDRWRSWRISESETVYNLTAAGLLKRLLVVVDKESLEVLHAATGSRFSSSWSAVEPSQFDQVAT